MHGDLVVMVAVGLFVGLLVGASVWSRAAKDRDGGRSARRRRRVRF